jgi:hypothetical protein
VPERPRTLAVRWEGQRLGAELCHTRSEVGTLGRESGAPRTVFSLHSAGSLVFIKHRLIDLNLCLGLFFCSAFFQKRTGQVGTTRDLCRQERAQFPGSRRGGLCSVRATSLSPYPHKLSFTVPTNTIPIYISQQSRERICNNLITKMRFSSVLCAQEQHTQLRPQQNPIAVYLACTASKLKGSLFGPQHMLTSPKADPAPLPALHLAPSFSPWFLPGILPFQALRIKIWTCLEELVPYLPLGALQGESQQTLQVVLEPGWAPSLLRSSLYNISIRA